MSLAAVPPIGSLATIATPSVSATVPTPVSPVAFSHLLSDGIAQVQDKVANADHMVKAFVLDDSIPVHQVSFALEQAHLSMELMLQVRSRLVEGYQQLMTMQM
jgi:flagellar hook-basal body complex protein FliE